MGTWCSRSSKLRARVLSQLIVGATVVCLLVRGSLQVKKRLTIFAVHSFSMKNISNSFNIDHPMTLGKFDVSEIELTEHNQSVLAVITGGWALEQFRDDKHFLYIDIIIRNYQEMCESGRKVRVFLITYASDEDWRWRDFIRARFYTCFRKSNDFAVEIQTFQKRPLPQGSHGTAGDLAIRHREIFQKYINMFDVFISQEDDVSIGVKNLEYFIRHEHALRDSHFYPGFVFDEFDDGIWYTDYRLRRGSIFKYADETYFVSKYGISPCMYMITRDELRHYLQNASWIDPNSIKGEFNVEVGTAAFMTSRRKIVIPLKHHKEASFHHLSNRYKRLLPYVMVKQPHPDNSPLHVAEQEEVFSLCANESAKVGSKIIHLSYRGTLRREACIECLQGKSISLDVRLLAGEQARQVEAIIDCEVTSPLLP